MKAFHTFTYKIEIKKKKKREKAHTQMPILYKYKNTKLNTVKAITAIVTQYVHYNDHCKLMIKINHGITYLEKRLLTFPIF